MDNTLRELQKLRDVLLSKKMLMKNGKTSFHAKSIMAQHADEILRLTSFLPDTATHIQRWYHINNLLMEMPQCGICKSAKCKFGPSDYNKTCSSKECHHKLKSILGGITKTGEIGRNIYKKRTETILAKNPNGLKEMGRKAAKTRKQLGTDKIGVEKAIKTKKQVGEDGLNIAQRARYKQIETLKNTPAESDPSKSRFDMVGENISKALTNNKNLIHAMRKAGLFKRTHKPDGINSVATLAALKGIKKCRETKEKKGTIIPLHLIPEHEQYARKVWGYTERNDLSVLPDIEKRSNHADNPDAYHLDHKYSIMQGFLDGVPPEVIGSIHNLQMLPWLDNVKKCKSCSITLEELLELYNNDPRKLVLTPD